MSNPELLRLIYVSAARGAVSAHELSAILDVSRVNNERDGLTGLLLFHDGSFFQTLEGAEESVMRTFARIERDPRHSRVLKLQSIRTSRRAFPNWSMGYVNARALRPDQTAHLVDLAHLVGTGAPADLTAMATVATQINAFLGSFREFESV